MAVRIELVDCSGRLAGSLWLGNFDRCYSLPDGQRCHVPQMVAWCRDCRAFVAAEAMPTLAEIDQVLQASRDAKELAEWQLVRRWRLLRTSPSRCLACFSSEIDAVPKNARQITHPLTGELLSINGVSFMDMAYLWQYTVEGLPLEETQSS